MAYQPDRYYLYDEMTSYLQDVAAAHPRWVRLESIGRSPEGREIWVLSITDTRAASFEDKPAYWIDANTHASEVTGSAAALYTVDYLLSHRDDESIAELLRERTIYIAPRVNPDGAEYCLVHQHYVRSARRLYPDPHVDPGLIQEDIDGDGEILQMRKQSPDGAWRISDKDPRLMLPRMPWHHEGPFYHLWAEGRFEEESLQDPRFPMSSQDPHGLDFNRNYPYGWRPEHAQKGAGPYPLSEPETRAVVDYLLAHPNVCGMLTYHTYTGVLLRPYSDRPDHEMAKFDLEVFDAIGERCEELTGYRCVSVFHDFRYDPKINIGGAFDDWAYDHYGVHCYTMELWSPHRAAGLEEPDDLLQYWRRPKEEDELAFLAWNDRELGGEAFVEWRRFDHPQLGEVEIGGWRFMFSFRNAPPRYLERECRQACLFSLDHARSGPRPRLELEVESLGEDLHRVSATMKNDGFLPTYVTELAKSSKLVRDLHLELRLDGELVLEDGRRKQRVEHLDGLANVTMPPWPSRLANGQTLGHVAQKHWVVRGSGAAHVSWWGDRIGRVEQTVTIGVDD